MSPHVDITSNMNYSFINNLDVLSNDLKEYLSYLESCPRVDEELYKLIEMRDKIALDELVLRQKREQLSQIIDAATFKHKFLDENNCTKFGDKGTLGRKIEECSPSNCNNRMNDLNDYIINESVETLKSIVKQNSLPVCEPPIFDGSDMEDYIFFKSSFDELIARSCCTDTQRYNYLLNYTTGTARFTVQCSFDIANKTLYEDAIAALDKRYGNRSHLADYYIKKIAKWPVIPSHDGNEMWKLSMYLKRVRNMMRDFDDKPFSKPREIGIILNKLPMSLRRKWVEEVFLIRQKGEQASIDDLIRIIEYESDVYFVLGLGSDTCEELSESDFTDKEQISDDRTDQDILFVCNNYVDAGTQVDLKYKDAKVFSMLVKKKYRKGSPCSICGRPHPIVKCEDFRALSYEQKRQLIYKKGLCFRCLVVGHVSAKCKAYVKCKVCDSPRHDTVLHKVN